MTVDLPRERAMSFMTGTFRAALSVSLLAALTLALAMMLRHGPRPAATSHPRDRASGSAGVLRYRGVAVQLTTGPGALDEYIPLLREVAGLGADTVLLSTAARMEHARSQAVFIDARETPSAADLVELMREARRLELRVVLMPLVLLKHPRGSEWRGAIEPPSWPEWWRDYRGMVEYFADAARAGGADVFMVGSELITTEKNTAEWQRLIAAVRARFPGRLGYSANWDHYKPIQFWDQLDLIGMTTYYTLSKKNGPEVEELVRAWEPIRKDITSWQRTIGKPLVFTEVGWCSQEGAASAPWNYYQKQNATPSGDEEQRRLYEAFSRAWTGTPELSGVIWWELIPPGRPDEPYSYSPRGKPAEQVLRQWFADTRPLLSAGPGSPPESARQP